MSHENSTDTYLCNANYSENKQTEKHVGVMNPPVRDEILPVHVQGHAGSTDQRCHCLHLTDSTYHSFRWPPERNSQT